MSKKQAESERPELKTLKQLGTVPPGAIRFPGPRVSFALAFAILLFGVFTAVATAVIVYRTFSPIIHWDQWIVVNELMHHHGHISLAWLWAQHNEHRIPIGKLACYADLKFFGGRNISLLCEIYLIQAMEALYLIWIFRHFSRPRPSQLLTAAGFFVFCAFYPIQIDNFAWGFEITFVLLPFFACVAIGTAVLHSHVISSCAQRAWFSWALLVSLASALAAELSLASGIFIWPVLLLSSIIFRMPWRTKGLIASVGAAAIWAFLWHYQSPANHANPLESVRHPIAVARYAASYLAWSWDSTSPTDAVWPTFAQLCVMLAIVIVCVRILKLAWAGAEPAKLEAFLLLNMVFVVITSVVTALGRINFGVEQAASSRYQTIALVFWASLLGLLLLWRSEKTNNPLRLVELQVVLVLLLVATVPRFVSSAAVAKVRQINLAQAYGMFVEDASSPKAAAAIAAQVYPYPNFAEAYMYLVSHHIGPDIENFRPIKGAVSPVSSSEMATSKLQGFRVVSSNQCLGFLDRVVRVPGKGQEVRAEGWAWTLASGEPPSRIVLALQDGTIVGSGRVFSPRQDVLDHIPQVKNLNTGWRVEALLFSGMTLRAFAISEDSRSACPLNYEFTRQ